MKYRVKIKSFSEQNFFDITSKTFNLSLVERRGFTKLGSSAEIGKVSLSFETSLSESISFGRDEKIVLIEDEMHRSVFYGYCDTFDIQATSNSEVAYVKANAYPFARAFENAKAENDLVFENCRVCDNSRPTQSLIHLLSEALYANIPQKYRVAQFRTNTSLTITTVLPIVVIKKGESINESFNLLLKEYGIARQVNVDPYSLDSICTYFRPFEEKSVTVVPYKQIINNPKIKSSPFVSKERLKVTLSIPIVYTDEIVYQLMDRAPSEDSDYKLTPESRSYPKDEDVLTASYGQDKSGQEFLYAVNAYTMVEMKEKGGSDASYYWETKEVGGTEAKLRISYTGNNEYAYLNNIKVKSHRAYYADKSKIIEDTSTEAPLTEYTAQYLVSEQDAQYFIKTQVMEQKGESNTFEFSSSKIAFAPNTLVCLGDSDAMILIRNVEKNLVTGESKASGILYNIITPTVAKSIFSTFAKEENRRTTTEYAKGTASAPILTGFVIGDTFYTLADEDAVLGEDYSWSSEVPVLERGEYLWERVVTYLPGEYVPSSFKTYRVTGENGSSTIIANRPTQSGLSSWWNTVSTTGSSYAWDNVANIEDFMIGDIMIINGVVSDNGNATIQVFVKVTSKEVANNTIVGTAQGCLKSIVGNPNTLGGTITQYGNEKLLSLGVFDSEGNLSDNQTIIYHQNNSYPTTIQGYNSWTLGPCDRGQGFIALIYTTPGVYFLIPLYVSYSNNGTESVPTWNDWFADSSEFNSSQIVCIVGEFDYTTEKVVFYNSTRSISDVYNTSYMQILGKLGRGDAVNTEQLNSLTQALGVERLFESMAVLRAFVDTLMANDIIVHNAIRSNTFVPQQEGFKLGSDGILRATGAELDEVKIGHGWADFGSLMFVRSEQTPHVRSEAQGVQQAMNLVSYFKGIGFDYTKTYPAKWVENGLTHSGSCKLIYDYVSAMGMTRASYTVSLFNTSGASYLNIETVRTGSSYTSSNTNRITSLTLYTGGNIVKADLPTSSIGLVSGQVWNNNGVMTIKS